MYLLRVQGSTTDIADSDFVTIATLTGQTPGQPFTVFDSPVPPGELRFYRARYECEADPTIVSDWSAIVTARGPYPVVATGDPATMGEIRTTGNVALAVSNPENVAGRICRAEKYLPFISHGLRVDRAVTEDPSNDGGVEDLRDIGPGVVRLPAPFTTNFVPGGGFLRVLASIYGLRASDVTDTAAAGGVAAYYDELWKPATDVPTISLLSKEGPDAFLYGGFHGNSYQYRASKTQSTPIQVSVEGMALSHAVLPCETEEQLAALGFATAGYATADPLGPVDWVLRLNGLETNCTDHGVSYNRNLQPGDVGNNFMGAKFMVPNRARVSVTATFFWDSLDTIQTFYGVTIPRRDFGVWKKIGKMPLSILYTPQVNAGNYRNETEFVAPRCAIRSLVKEIPETGAIMQQVELQPLKDPSQGNLAHWWRTRTDEGFSTITRKGWEVAYIPKQEVFPWWCLDGKVAAGATTTTFAAQANARLSSVDDVYNGKTLRLLLPPSSNSPLKGLERTITDYVGSTRTFTLSSAFPSAPPENTEFLIVLAEPAA